jgi:hypothetical protein
MRNLRSIDNTVLEINVYRNRWKKPVEPERVKRGGLQGEVKVKGKVVPVLN